VFLDTGRGKKTTHIAGLASELARATKFTAAFTMLMAISAYWQMLFRLGFTMSGLR
jgi:hypothetical protein